jgi:putative tryptophan/tyrosine transport system substrate-binding protein
MTTIVLLVTLALAILVAPLTTEAQQATQVHRIGLLYSSPASPAPMPSLEAFRQGLRDLGYIEGHNLVLEPRWAEGSEARLRELAAELVRLSVDVLVPGGTRATLAAQHATRTIPIVMLVGVDPVAAGLISSLGHPGGNMTGLSVMTGELSGKQLEFLKEAVPMVSRVAVLANPTDPNTPPRLQYLQGVAHALRVQLHVMEVQSREDVERAFAAIQREGIGAFLVLSDTLLMDQVRSDIAAFALRYRLPAMYTAREDVEAGGLMTYRASLPDMYRRAATYVDKILKGTKPGDLPVEQPTKFELVINLKTAKALGLTIPPVLLFQADEVIR